MKTQMTRDEVVQWLLQYALDCEQCGSAADAQTLAKAVQVLRRHEDEEEEVGYAG